MRTQGLLLPVNAKIQRVLSQTASGSSCPIVRLRWHGLDDSNRCIADIDQTFSLGDQQRRVALHQGKAPCTASSFGIAYRDARNGQALSRVPAPVLAA